jgi:hypothetical protein
VFDVAIRRKEPAQTTTTTALLVEA